jgi:hypothetical protein
MSKRLRLFGIAAVIAFALIGGVILNAYLSNNNLLIYSTGTSDKAFLKATWKMSPREIERANNATLSNSDMLDPFTPEVINQGRFKALVQKDVFLWGHLTQVEYAFFDNMLYEYYISLDAYDLEKPHREILKTLHAQFGEGKEDEIKRADIIHSHDWETERQTISYWMGKSEGKKNYYVGIRARYKPFYKQIEEIAKIEKKGYF